ncbi:MAG: von Willebrand factor type A domain-containing protein [Planctomycetaceae bacterium]|nr:von Willebrand factor type A domain-containing protein [Planctomycetaceae bacterium]
MMNIDDPKLTAYALGELDEHEAAQIESQLKDDPAAAAAVESIRALAGQLTVELAAEKSEGLTSQHLTAIKETAMPSTTRRSRIYKVFAGSVAAAAAVIVVVLVATANNRTAAPKAVEVSAIHVPARQSENGLSKDPQGKKAAGAPAGYVQHRPPVSPPLPVTVAPAKAPGQAGTRARDWKRKFEEVREKRDSSGLMEVEGLPDVLYSRLETTYSDHEKLRLGDSQGYRAATQPWNREAYDQIVENPFMKVMDHPLSTFSIDVDTASYANLRRMLNAGQLPPKGAVRIEEMVNYFDYSYAGPKDDVPFAAVMDITSCPWAPKHRLARVAIKAKEVKAAERPAGNFVFLLDVSGSMNEPNKLPLVKASMQMLVRELNKQDRIAMVVYAGASGLVLDSTPCDRKEDILAAIERLSAGGSTNGGAGIELAYKVAAANFIKGGINRVILCTDGDFNVGTTDQGSLTDLITAKAKTGVFLSVLGFGMGNLQDSTLEKLADKGNGNYGYIDTLSEARKLFVKQIGGTLVTVAKDVKIQVEFNPAKVASYRLIGYENRMLRKEDFNDDKKDAGEIGAGHTVTVLYELIPAGDQVPASGVDDLKYSRPAQVTEAAKSGETLTLKLRYKAPDGDTSKLLSFPIKDEGKDFPKADADMQFAAAVASFGMQLRDSQYKGAYTLDAVLELARSAKGADAEGYRAEFIKLVEMAKSLGKIPEPQK